MKPFRPAELVIRVKGLLAQAEYCPESLPLRRVTI